MKARHRALIVACVVMVSGVWPAAALQLLDVLFLKDGSSATGVIMEEEPGKSLILETEDGEMLEYRLRDIARIEKLFAGEQSLIENRDVVYLKDGVVFPGTIVARVPGEEIRLELEDGHLLDFNMNEILKIGKEQIATGVVKEAVVRPQKAEQERIEIQIQIAMNQLESKRQKLKAGGQASEVESLREEVDRLNGEIEQMKERKKAVDNEAAEEQAKFAQIESELGEPRERLLNAAAELEQQITACRSPQVKERLLASYEELERNIEELLNRAQVIALMEQPDPRTEEIELQEKATDALAIFQNRLWGDPEIEARRSRLVAELPYEERRKIYDEARSASQVRAVLLNVIPFSFIGSWKQKDYVGGSVGLGLETAGLGVWVYEALSPGESQTLLMAGGFVVLGAWAYGIVRPLSFASRYNRKLRKALELSRREVRNPDAERAAMERGYVFPAPPSEPQLQLTLVRFEY